MELVVAPIPEDAPNIFLPDFIGDLKKFADDSGAVHIFDKNTKALRLRECKIDEKQKLVHLLVNYADTNLTDPAFENLETGDLRIEPKLRGEGIAVSTHLTIDLVPKSPKEPIYAAYLEDVPGIGRTKLVPFLTSIAKQAGINFPWTDPNKKERKSRPSFTLVGAQSQKLKDDLKAGRLSWIELSKHHVDSRFDEEGILEEDRRTIVLKVKKNMKDKAVDLINRVRKKARDEGYTDMKVAYSPEEGRQTSAKFGTAREDVGDVLTIKVSEILLGQPRLQCETDLRDDVVTKLAELAVSNRNQ